MGQQIASGHRLTMINFYKEQLKKFSKLGLGKQTETGITVTDTLISATTRRLKQLQSVYDYDLTGAAFRQREKALLQTSK